MLDRWQVAMEDKRVNKTDRRQQTEKLPLWGRHENKIPLDRRYFPDRRKSHYDPKW